MRGRSGFRSAVPPKCAKLNRQDAAAAALIVAGASKMEALAVASAARGPKMEIPTELFAGAATLIVLHFGPSRGTCRLGLSASRLFAFPEDPALVSITSPRC